MRRWWCALAVLWGLVPLGAAAGQLVVVSDSDAFGYKRGTVIEDGAAVKVPEGSRLLLIDAGGHGVTVRGPYDGGVHSAPGGSDDRTVLAAVQTILSGPQREEIGVVRGGGEDVHPPDARLVDLTHGGTDCVAQGKPVELWRPPPEKRTTLFVTRLSTGDHTEVDWPTGASTMAWPEAIKVTDGETYILSLQGAMAKTRLVLRVAAFGGASIETAKRLADLDCRGQALTMLESIADPGSR